MLKKIIALLMVLVLMSGCQVNSSKRFRQKEISYQKLTQKLENKDSFIVLIGKEDCPFCRQLESYLKKTKKDHQGLIYYFDVHQADQSFLKWFPGYFYTPTIYVIKKGKPVTSAQGFIEDDHQMLEWDVDTKVDLESAKRVEVWDFLEKYFQEL